MDNFKMKNELGIEFEYTVVAHKTIKDEKYIIYTDFVLDKQGDLRLFAGKIENGKVVRINSELERYIISDFEDLKENYVESALEGIK